MNLENYFIYFQNAIPPKICDDIVKYGLQEQEKIALTGNLTDSKKLSKNELKDLRKKRDSNIAWLDDKWIYKEIHPWIHNANKIGNWNFDWDWSEPCQFTKYKIGQFYDWHCDSWNKPYDNVEDKNRHGKIRKLSVTVSLSDPNDYKGGELQFDPRNYDNFKKRHVFSCKGVVTKGTVIVFPSHVWHKVAPVTKGIRYSLVIWNLGYPFR